MSRGKVALDAADEVARLLDGLGAMTALVAAALRHAKDHGTQALIDVSEGLIVVADRAAEDVQALREQSEIVWDEFSKAVKE